MATLTVYSSSGDGSVRCHDSTYSTARTGGGSKYTSSTIMVGQNYSAGTYICYEGLTHFNTSTLTSSADITSVKCELYLSNDYTDTDYTQELRAYDWQSSLSTLYYVSGANLGNYTLLASTAVSPSSGYNEWSSSDNFKAAISKTGTTRVLFNSSRHRLATTPSGQEMIYWYGSAASGTTQDPKLTVEYTLIINKSIAASSDITASLKRDVDRALSASSDVTASLTRGIPRLLSSYLDSTASLKRDVDRVLSASSDMVTSLLRAATKVITGGLSISSTLNRLPKRILSVSTDMVSTLTRYPKKIVIALVNVMSSKLNDITKSVSGSADITGTRTTASNKIVTFLSDITATVSRAAGYLKSLSASVDAVSSTVKGVSRTLTASVSVTSSILKTVSKIIVSVSVKAVTTITDVYKMFLTAIQDGVNILLTWTERGDK